MLWHSLNESGHIEVYDVKWPDGTVETNIHHTLLEKVKDSDDNINEMDPHEAHGVVGHRLNSSVGERKYKNLKEVFSKDLLYHIEHNVGVDRNIHRPGSDAFFALFREVRRLNSRGLYTLNESEFILLENSELGDFGYYEGKRVPLDYPMLYEDDLDEAKYKNKKVDLNKPKRSQGGKAYVYVNSGKKDKKGRIKVKKVSFGSSMPDAMGKSEEHRKRRKSYGARHNCADKKDKTKPGYWSCRATKFFGRNISGWW